MKHWPNLIQKFLKYVLIGCINASLCFLVMAAFAWVGFGYLIYTASGYFIAMIASFFMNRHFTFAVKENMLYRISLFFFINMTNLLCVEVIEYILIDKFLCPQTMAVLIGMMWYTVSGFFMNNYWVYRPQTSLPS